VSDPGHRGAAAAGDAGGGESSAGHSGRLDLLALPRQASMSGLGAVSNVGSAVSGTKSVPGGTEGSRARARNLWKVGGRKAKGWHRAIEMFMETLQEHGGA